MAQYIDKSALVAEIERRIEEITQTISLGDKKIQKSGGNRRAELVRFLSFLDTLEVKEVDLEREQRIKECPYRQVKCTMYEDKVLECKGACSWVADYHKLKEFKAQKGG